MSAGQLCVGVVGGGPWGVALSMAAHRAGADVILFSRRQSSDHAGTIRITHLEEEVAKAQLLVVAVPSAVARQVLRALGDHLSGAHFLVHGVRGLSGDALETISDIAREETPVRRFGALGGPVQANELRAALPSAMVIGSHYPEVISSVRKAFASPSLHVVSTPDLRGLEWASALVGCLAIGVGFAKQAGAGPGLLAALISRGMDEAARLTAAAGADEKTMLGLGGYGDLLASIGLDARPEVVIGRALARGATLEDAVLEAHLRVEAIALIPRLLNFARERSVSVSTFEALLDVLEGKPAQAIVKKMFGG